MDQINDRRGFTWGEWAFLAGLIIAIVLGFSSNTIQAPWVGPTLAVLGVMIGLLNVTAKETTKFLLSSIVLLLVGSAGLQNIPYVGQYMDNILWNITQLVAPASLIVALLAVVQMARKR